MGLALMMVMAMATRTIPVLQAAQSIQTMMMNLTFFLFDFITTKGYNG